MGLIATNLEVIWEMSVQGSWQVNQRTLFGGMRTLRAICLICGLSGLVTPALPDQTDPRLNDLFAHLKDVSGPAEAAPVEQQIWAIWLEVSDPAVGSLMQSGIDDMNRRDHPAALEAFDQVVAIAPDFAEGWNKRATVHYLMGNLNKSLEDIARTLELEPRHFGALSGRGLVYAKLDDLERALDSFEAAVAVNPQMVGPRINAEAIRQILKGREI
jgi:tetratricopeptide (TPR) repeat protein